MADVGSRHESSTGAMVAGVVTGGGIHCETTALGVLLRHLGVELSESMLFGLGGGLSYIYWDSKRQDVPFVGGRVRPFALTRAVTARLGLDLHVHETSSAARAWARVHDDVQSGTPVGLQLDSQYLEYFTTKVPFAGHIAAMRGFDADRAHLVDTDQQGGAVSTSRASLARARAARGPMSARHRSFTITRPVGESEPLDPRSALIPAIVDCATAFLEPPIANVGIRGIGTTAVRIGSWYERVSDPRRDLPGIATTMERAGTGGALLRNIFHRFLEESAGLFDTTPAADVVGRAADLYAISAGRWTGVAERVERAGLAAEPQRLAEAAELLDEIVDIEATAMTMLRDLSVPRRA